MCMGGDKEDKGRLFLVVPGDRTKGNRNKLEHKTFYLNRTKYFALQEHWNGLPRDPAESHSLETF